MTAPYDTHDRDDPAGAAASGSAIDPTDPAYAGQAVYTRPTLRAYDTLVVRLSNTLVWRCPARTILAHYDAHVTDRHLDVGPGTGYYLQRCRFPGSPGLALLDPNTEVLRFAGERLRRYEPALHAADALEPVGLPPASFDSIGLSYVLHCLPGDIASKAVVLDHLTPLLSPGGVLFGATILSHGVRLTRIGRTLLPIYNRKGIFSNPDDSLEDLNRALVRRFERYDVEVHGAVALFAGWASARSEAT